MKTLILILLISFTVLAQQDDFYVNSDTTGRNQYSPYDGTSWNEAWQFFTQIEWDSLQGGGTLYLSGGTDTTVYYEQLLVGADTSGGTRAENGINGSAGNHIIIRNSYDAGHNGVVLIDAESETRANSILIGGNTGTFYASYITIKGIECTGGTQGIRFRYYVDHGVIDSCIVYDWYDQGGIKVEGAGGTPYTEWGINDIEIKNCRVISFVNEDGQTDGLYLQRAARLVVHDNFVQIRNHSLINNHSDGLQTHLIRNMKVYNNIMITDSGAQGMPAITRAEAVGTSSDSVIYYNNFFYCGGLWFDGAPNINITDQQENQVGATPSNHEPPTIFIHNTLVSHGPTVAAVWWERNDEQKNRWINNIVAQFGDGVALAPSDWHQTLKGNNMLVDSITGGLYWCEYEDFGVEAGTVVGSGGSPTGVPKTWSAYTTTYGGTGTYGDPLFVNDFSFEYLYANGTTDLNGELQSNSPAIDEGIDVQAIVEGMGFEWIDINGLARDSTPDIGAYEYISGAETASTKLIMKK